MAKSHVDHDRPFTLRILTALMVTGVYYGLVAGLSIRLFLIITRCGPTYWLTVPLGAAITGAGIAYCTLAWLWIASRQQPAVQEVRPHQTPQLYRLVKDTAAELGMRSPNWVYVSHRANGFSLFWGILGFNVQWSGLGVGLPVLAVLSPQELKGLIGHELGHMQSLRDRSGDGWYLWAAYNYWSCSETLSNSSVFMRVTCPQVWFAFLMTHLTWPIACQEELTADACAVHAVSPEVHGAALEGIAVAQEMFREFLATEVNGLLELGICPRNIFEGFRQHVQRRSQSDRESLLARYHERDATRDFADSLGAQGHADEAPCPQYGIMPEDRWDPHPRLDHRMEHLRAVAPKGKIYRPAPSATFARVDEGIERELSQLVLAPLLARHPGVAWQYVPWQNLDELAGLGAAAASAPSAQAVPAAPAAPAAPSSVRGFFTPASSRSAASARPTRKVRQIPAPPIATLRPSRPPLSRPARRSPSPASTADEAIRWED